MNDFIFGTLATDNLRLSFLRELRGGVTHRSARSPRDPLPGQPVALDLTVGPTHPVHQTWVYWSTDGQDPTGSRGAAKHGYATPMEPVDSEWDVLEWGYIRRFRAVLPGQPAGTVIRYYIAAGSSSGEEIIADRGAMYGYYVDNDPLPDWARDAVVYQIMVDRFSPGLGKPWLPARTPADFYGGTLRGVTEGIDFLADLGVTALWMTPIFPSPTHHGYDTTDFFEIEPRLGSKQDLRELLDKAHRAGIRILLDLVPNHLSNQHAVFKQALSSPTSPEVNWFTFNHWPDQYETFFGVDTLPKINLRHPAARQHMLDAAAYWLEFGVDGYRLDYATGPTPDFWADFRKVTRQTRPDCWTFGEVVEPSDSQLAFEGLLDGCLDFMLLEAFRQTFAFGQWDAARFLSFLDRHESYFPPDFSRPSFLDNHDMNRFLWAAEGDLRKLKIAALCQFTLAGPPVVYYGSEVGLSQERDVRQGSFGLPEESRLPMIWGKQQDANLLAFYRDLIHLRRSNSSLIAGKRVSLDLGPDCVAYQRNDDGQEFLILINISTRSITIDLDSSLRSLVLATDAACVFHDSRVNLPPYSGVILRS